MPEGDTIFRAAQTMHRALAGRAVTRFETVLPKLARIDADHPIAGRAIESVTARGKHLLIAISGDLLLHTHMRMNGSWHLYRPGERWRRPRRDMRILIVTAEFEAVGFNLPVAELLSARDLERHKELASLGPDLLAPDFDRIDVVNRIGARPSEPIGEVLVNQRVMAGIGNVFKSEILFVAGIDPFARVDALTERDLARLIDAARRLMRNSVRDVVSGNSPAKAAQDRWWIGRRTTERLDPRERLWVYGRGGKPCRKCGVPIQARKTGVDARLTFWCPRCQRRPLDPV